MTEPVIIGNATWYLGDCLEQLRAVPANSVQCCVTSPPYFGLRDYGHPGQIGLEPTPDDYVARMVAVFAEVRRVLTEDGVCWVNLGDSYASNQSTQGGCSPKSTLGGGGGRYRTGSKNEAAYLKTQTRKIEHELKPKDLIGIPWRVAFALQADGWYLRQDIIWHKPNPMPESVADRCTKSHEYLFLLTKSARYFYDADAIKEPVTRGYAGSDFRSGKTAIHLMNRVSQSDRIEADTRNRRSVWTIPTQPYTGAHFAVMPPALVEPCILAGSRPGDLILDPFGGSGTVGAVAVRNGRHAALIELNPDYAPLIFERLTTAQRQPDMFTHKARPDPAPPKPEQQTLNLSAA